jgi:predicted AAA+ superfamily ATPase
MFSQLIKNNQEKFKELSLKKRDYTFHDEILNLNKIISFIWPRRVWKTYLMFQFIKELIKNWTYSNKQIVYLDFSIFKWEIINSDEIIKSYFSLWNKEKPVLILDEIQDIENFQKVVLQLYTQWYQLFISWSNSKLLSKELVTEFRWRVYEYFVSPLSFEEILTFNKIKKEKKYSSEKQWIIKNLLKEILEYWNFPELVIAKKKIVKTEILKSYFEILFYKDLIERYKIDNEKSIKFLIKKLIIWNTKRLNLIKIFNELKSQWVKVWKTTIYNYFEYLKNIFFVEDVNNFYKKTSNLYLYNFWFNVLFWLSENLWQNFENFVYLNLKKKYNKIFYKEDKNEIDFYIPEKNLNIQVCYNLNSENIEREILPFKNQKSEKNILIYFDKNIDIEKYENIEFVEIMDIWEI